MADEAWRCPILPAGHSGKYCLFRKLVLPPGITVEYRVEKGVCSVTSWACSLSKKQGSPGQFPRALPSKLQLIFKAAHQ